MGPVLARAIRLARANDAQLTIFNLAREISGNLANVQKVFLRLQERQLEELAQKAAAEGAAVNSRIPVGYSVSGDYPGRRAQQP